MERPISRPTTPPAMMIPEQKPTMDRKICWSMGEISFHETDILLRKVCCFATIITIFSMERILENMRFFCTFVKLNSIIKRCGNGQNIVAADFIIESLI